MAISLASLAQRNYGRVLFFKPGMIRSLKVQARKSSKIPDLMRYIPKQERKTKGDKLESVCFPKQQVHSNYSSAEEQEEEDHDFINCSAEEQEEEDHSLKLCDHLLVFHRKSSVKQPPCAVRTTPASGNSIKRSQTEAPASVFRTTTTSGNSIRRSQQKVLSQEQLLEFLVPASKLNISPRAANNDSVKEAQPLKSTAAVLDPGTLNHFAMSLNQTEALEFLDSEDGFPEEDEAEETSFSPQDNPGERSAARNYAIFLLSKWQRTAAELRKKLVQKNYSPKVIESTISELKEEGFQSDASYAEVFAQSRWNSRGWGSKRLRHELRGKGVNDTIIDKALLKVFKPDEDDSEAARWGMSEEAKQHILTLSARKWKSGGNISVEVRNRRLAAWLQRRGFSWKVIKGVTDILQRNECEECEEGD